MAQRGKARSRKMAQHSQPPVFQKSGLGKQALESRDRTLDHRSRQMLILCNGRTSLSELRAALGDPADALLQGLLARGLVERVEPAAMAQLPRVRTVSTNPAATAPAGPVPAPNVDIDLPAAKARALSLLESLFGPGGGSHGLAVWQAADAAAFERVLAGVHDAIRIYQGKKRAAQLVQQIRTGR
jgi:hypothetical protein